jgi:hypothetical protein
MADANDCLRRSTATPEPQPNCSPARPFARPAIFASEAAGPEQRRLFRERWLKPRAANPSNLFLSRRTFLPLPSRLQTHRFTLKKVANDCAISATRGGFSRSVNYRRSTA